MRHRLHSLVLASFLLAAPRVHAVDLHRETIDAFDKYVSDLETISIAAGTAKVSSGPTVCPSAINCRKEPR